jgi:ABC-2 type transport system permease protein
MFNIFLADSYKFFKSKTFYVSLFIALLFATLMVVATYYGLERMGEPGGPPQGAVPETAKALYFSAIDSGITLMLIAIVTSIFVANEYTTGVIKDTVSSGKSRTNIFISKIIITTISAFLIVLISAIYQLTLGTAFIGYGSSFNWSEVWLLTKTFLSAMVIITAFNALFVTLTTAFKSLGASLASNVGIIMFGGLIFSLIELIHSVLENVGDYWLSNNLTEVVTNASINTFSFTPLIIASAYFVVSLVIGIKIFKKQDIK